MGTAASGLSNILYNANLPLEQAEKNLRGQRALTIKKRKSFLPRLRHCKLKVFFPSS